VSFYILEWSKHCSHFSLVKKKLYTIKCQILSFESRVDLSCENKKGKQKMLGSSMYKKEMMYVGQE